MEQSTVIEAIRKGDKESFRHFYEIYADSAIRVASAITRNREMAKDAVQEAFIRVYRNIGSYQSDQPFDPWFYRIVTNECLRLIKKDAPLSQFELNDLENNPSIAEASLESVSDLYDCIQTLDDIHRIPLILKYVKGFTEKEIAEILELNQNTVKSRLFKGRVKLRELLDFGKEDEPL